MTKVQMEEKINELTTQLEEAKKAKEYAEANEQVAIAELKNEEAKNANLKAVLKDLLINEPNLET